MRNLIQNIAIVILSVTVFASCGSRYHEDLGPSDDTPDWGIPVDETPDWGIPVDSIPDVDISDKIDAKYRMVHTYGSKNKIVSVVEYDIQKNATFGTYQKVEYDRNTFEVVGVRHYAFDARVGIKEDPSGVNRRFTFTPIEQDMTTQVYENDGFQCKEEVDPSAYGQLSFSSIENNLATRINDFSFSLCELTYDDIKELHETILNEL